MKRFEYIGLIIDEEGTSKELYVDNKCSHTRVLSLDQEGLPKTEIDLSKNYVSPTINKREVRNMLKMHKQNKSFEREFNRELISIGLSLCLISGMIVLGENLPNKLIEHAIETEKKSTNKSEKEIIIEKIVDSINQSKGLTEEEKEQAKKVYKQFYEDNYFYFSRECLVNNINSHRKLKFTHKEEDKKNTRGTYYRGSHSVNIYDSAISSKEYFLSTYVHEIAHDSFGEDNNALEEAYCFSISASYTGVEVNNSLTDMLIVLGEVLGKEFVLKNIRNINLITQTLAEELNVEEKEIKDILDELYNYYIYEKSEIDLRISFKKLLTLIQSSNNPSVINNQILKYMSKDYYECTSTIFDDDKIFSPVGYCTDYESIIVINDENKFLNAEKILTKNIKDKLTDLYKNYILQKTSKEEQDLINILVLLLDNNSKKELNISNFADEIMKAIEKNNIENPINSYKDILNIMAMSERYIPSQSIANLTVCHLNRIYDIKLESMHISLEDIADIKMVLEFLSSYECYDYEGAVYILSEYEKGLKEILSEEEFNLVKYSNIEWKNKDAIDYYESEIIPLSDIEIKIPAIPKEIKLHGYSYIYYQIPKTSYNRGIEGIDNIYLEIYEDGMSKKIKTLTKINIDGTEEDVYLFINNGYSHENAQIVWSFKEKEPLILKKYIQTKQ